MKRKFWIAWIMALILGLGIGVKSASAGNATFWLTDYGYLNGCSEVVGTAYNILGSNVVYVGASEQGCHQYAVSGWKAAYIFIIYRDLTGGTVQTKYVRPSWPNNHASNTFPITCIRGHQLDIGYFHEWDEAGVGVETLASRTLRIVCGG